MPKTITGKRQRAKYALYRLAWAVLMSDLQWFAIYAKNTDDERRAHGIPSIYG